MWIITPDGFYSAVRKPGTDHLTVRARSGPDLDRLRERWLPELGSNEFGTGTDYPVRATCSHREFADGLGRIALAIDYSNFKNRVGKELGPGRASICSKVWSDLRAIEQETVDSSPFPAAPPRTVRAYGGLILDENRRKILLREPARHFGGYVWTYPKGQPDKGESPESAALREVREETGIEAEITGSIRHWYGGDTSHTAFFVMGVVKDHGDFQTKETQRVRWATLDEAEELIRETTSARGRARDLEVLADLREHLDS